MSEPRTVVSEDEAEQFKKDAFRKAFPALYDIIDTKTGEARPAVPNPDKLIHHAVEVASRALRFRRHIRRTRNSTEPPPTVVNQTKEN